MSTTERAAGSPDPDLWLALDDPGATARWIAGVSIWELWEEYGVTQCYLTNCKYALSQGAEDRETLEEDMEHARRIGRQIRTALEARNCWEID